jgi:uncharacterized protein (DUF934 family)
MSRLTLFRADAFVPTEAVDQRLRLAADADPREHHCDAYPTIELCFAQFNDGRAYSQAFLLRRRLGFTGELRAVGDVLVDEVLLMQRGGCSQAVLRADQSLADAEQALRQFSGFYQGDAVDTAPRFAKDAAA